MGAYNETENQSFPSSKQFCQVREERNLSRKNSLERVPFGVERHKTAWFYGEILNHVKDARSVSLYRLIPL